MSEEVTDAEEGPLLADVEAQRDEPAIRRQRKASMAATDITRSRAWKVGKATRQSGEFVRAAQPKSRVSGLRQPWRARAKSELRLGVYTESETKPHNGDVAKKLALVHLTCVTDADGIY